MRASTRVVVVVVACVLAPACGTMEGPSGGGAVPAPVPAAPVHDASMPGPWDKPGFRTFEADGRIWVFREGSGGLRTFIEKGEPAKSVTRPGVGPGGATMRSDSTETIHAFLSVREGFETLVDGRVVWVARPGSGELQAILAKGAPANAISMEGAGPAGLTVRGVDRETVQEYCYARDGFVTSVVDGRLWVFKAGSADLETFRKSGEPAKSVTRPGKGPGGITLRSGDAGTLDAYMAAR